MAVIDLKKATIKIKDGGSEEIEINVGDGNVTYTEKRNYEYLKNKGALDTVREGDEEPMDVKFEFRWEYLSGSTSTGNYPSIEEALKGTGAAKDWASTSDDACEPYCVDIEIAYDPTSGAPANCTGDTETITLRMFRCESFEHDLRAGTVSCTGKCNVTDAEVVRAA